MPWAEFLTLAPGRLEEAQAGIKIAGRNTNNLIYADDTTLMEESEKELKSLWMKVKEIGLKLNIQKMKIMASGPMTSWEIDGETVETVSDLGGGKIGDIVVLQSPSHVQLFATPWTATRQAYLSFIIYRSLLKLMSIESVMPS